MIGGGVRSRQFFLEERVLTMSACLISKRPPNRVLMDQVPMSFHFVHKTNAYDVNYFAFFQNIQFQCIFSCLFSVFKMIGRDHQNRLDLPSFGFSKVSTLRHNNKGQFHIALRFYREKNWSIIFANHLMCNQ